MPKESDRPRPHGDPLEDEIVQPNPSQRQTDAPADMVGSDVVEDSTGTGSTSNGVPADDETDGKRRRGQYNDGAGLVSRID
jgi:hypothetical protein